MSEDVKVFISENEIKNRVGKLAAQISKDYEKESLTLICVLKGAVIFTADLARELTLDVTLDFIAVSSYGDETKTSGVIKIDYDLKCPVTGQNVLLVEDIIDSGRTLASLYAHLTSQKPKSLRLCALLDKPDRREVFDVSPAYTGFSISDEFVVGYGMDYAQKYRNLPYIGILNSI